MAAQPHNEREQDNNIPAFSAEASYGAFRASLKIYDRWLVAAAGVGIFVFCIKNPQLVTDTLKKALEVTEGLVVGRVQPGSILVELYCRTKESFLLFMDDFKTKKLKRRLNMEFQKIGYKEELEVTITNVREAYMHLEQLQGSSLSDVLTLRPDLIEQLALRLDRQMRLIPNWKHFSHELKVDAEVINRLEQYADFSPTIRLFEHLETVQPDLTIQRLKQAFSDIGRNDLLSLLTTTAAISDNELVREVITSRYFVAPSPNLGLLDEIALKLDMDSRVLANWSSLAAALGVREETFKQFARRSTQSPTKQLFEYLATTRPDMTVKSLVEALNNTKRNDLIAILQEKNPQEFVKDVLPPGSELLQTVADKLDTEAVSWKNNWLQLAYHLKISCDVYQGFETKEQPKSPTKEVMRWLVAHSPDIMLVHIVEALENIRRNDVIQIITQHFPDTVDSSPERLSSSFKNNISFDEPSSTRTQIYKRDDKFTCGSVLKQESPRISNLPSQTMPFVGRDAVVHQIKAKLESNSSRMIILIALPGMGKSEVAIGVGHLLQNENWPVVFVKEKKLIDICEKILYQLGHRYWTLHYDVVSTCKRKLLELKEDTIIILDNTDDAQKEKGFDELLKHLMSASKVRTIVTTQYDIETYIAPASIQKIRLEPLDPSSSSELLTQLVPQISTHYAEEIGELCGRVPIFLVCCACSMKADGFCPEVFTRELRKNPLKVFVDSKQLTPTYSNIGRFFAHVLPEHILKNLVRLSVFPTSFSVNDMRFLFIDDFELQAVKTKMIQCNLLKKLNDGDVFTILPLFKACCRAERETLNMSEEGRSAEIAFNHHYLELLRDLQKLFITNDSSLKAIQRFREKKANILEAFENCFRDTSDPKEKVFAVDVANEVSNFLVKVTPPTECTSLYQKCCNFARDSADEKRLAYSLNSSGFRCLDHDAAHSKGDGADKAFEKFQEACTIFSQLPEETQKCETYAHVKCKLGLCVLLQGDEARGRQLILEGIKLREELGTQLYVAAGNCDLGHSYRHCGDYQKALEIWKSKTLPIYLEKLGVHPWSASVNQHIASMYLKLAQKDAAQCTGLAEIYTIQALEMRQSLLGRMHQDTARSHIRLSDVYFIQGKFEWALAELEEALEIQKDILGDDHQVTLNTMKKKSEVLEALRRLRH